LKFITELHETLKDKELWIAGSDPSLDSYPDNFFDDTLFITLHMAYLKFPQSTFNYANEIDRVIYLNEKYPDYKHQTNIFAYPFFARSGEQSLEVIKDFTDVYHLKLVPYPPRKNPSDIFSPIGVNAMKEQVIWAKKGASNTFGGHGTCLHACLYFAIMTGANPIKIIGCNHKTINTKDHFGEVEELNLEMRKNRPQYTDEQGKGKGERMTIGTNAIIEQAKEMGVNIMKFTNYDNYLAYEEAKGSYE
jgi:hypothetical protein